jgi:hypothetical protein
MGINKISALQSVLSSDWAKFGCINPLGLTLKTKITIVSRPGNKFSDIVSIPIREMFHVNFILREFLNSVTISVNS